MHLATVESRNILLEGFLLASSILCRFKKILSPAPIWSLYNSFLLSCTLGHRYNPNGFLDDFPPTHVQQIEINIGWYLPPTTFQIHAKLQM